MIPIHLTHGSEEGSQFQTYQASHLCLLCLISEAPRMCGAQNNNCRHKPRETHARLLGRQLPGERSEMWTGTELKGGGTRQQWTAGFPSNLTRQETARRICMKIASQRTPPMVNVMPVYIGRWDEAGKESLEWNYERWENQVEEYWFTSRRENLSSVYFTAQRQGAST